MKDETRKINDPKKSRRHPRDTRDWKKINRDVDIIDDVDDDYQWVKGQTKF